MKIAVLTANYAADATALSAIASSSLSKGDLRYCGGTDACYEYYPNVGGTPPGSVRPDDLTVNDAGRWVLDQKLMPRLLFPVDDAYDFVANSATDVTAQTNLAVSFDGDYDTGQPAHLSLYKLNLEINVDNHIGKMFWDTVTLPRVTFEAQSFIMLEHMVKDMEAQDYLNDRDSRDIQPTTFRRDGSNNKVHKVIEAEATKRGITKDQMADAIDPWKEYQNDLVAVLSPLRSPTKDAIRAAADHAAVDTIWSTFKDDVAAAIVSVPRPA